MFSNHASFLASGRKIFKIAFIATELNNFMNLFCRTTGYSRAGRTYDYTRPTESSRSAVSPSSYSSQPSAARTGSSDTARYGTGVWNISKIT